MPKQPEVEAWLAAYDNPMKPVVERVREILLAADPRIDECIKWKTPTFTYAGYLVSFNPRSKTHASLLFHTGASIPGDFPSLEGGGDTARYMKIANLTEAKKRKKELVAIVKAWIAMKDAKKTSKKKSAKKKTAKKKR